MIELLGKKYITEKEASQRFCYSASWFEKRRHDNKPPPYIKLNGKILYEVTQIEEWFRKQISEFY